MSVPYRDAAPVLDARLVEELADRPCSSLSAIEWALLRPVTAERLGRALDSIVDVTDGSFESVARHRAALDELESLAPLVRDEIARARATALPATAPPPFAPPEHLDEFIVDVHPFLQEALYRWKPELRRYHRATLAYIREGETSLAVMARGTWRFPRPMSIACVVRIGVPDRLRFRLTRPPLPVPLLSWIPWFRPRRRAPLGDARIDARFAIYGSLEQAREILSEEMRRLLVCEGERLSVDAVDGDLDIQFTASKETLYENVCRAIAVAVAAARSVRGERQG